MLEGDAGGRGEAGDFADEEEGLGASVALDHRSQSKKLSFGWIGDGNKGFRTCGICKLRSANVRKGGRLGDNNEVATDRDVNLWPEGSEFFDVDEDLGGEFVRVRKNCVCGNAEVFDESRESAAREWFDAKRCGISIEEFEKNGLILSVCALGKLGSVGVGEEVFGHEKRRRKCLMSYTKHTKSRLEFSSNTILSSPRD